MVNAKQTKHASHAKCTMVAFAALMLCGTGAIPTGYAESGTPRRNVATTQKVRSLNLTKGLDEDKLTNFANKLVPVTRNNGVYNVNINNQDELLKFEEFLRECRRAAIKSDSQQTIKSMSEYLSKFSIKGDLYKKGGGLLQGTYDSLVYQLDDQAQPAAPAEPASGKPGSVMQAAIDQMNAKLKGKPTTATSSAASKVNTSEIAQNLLKDKTFVLNVCDKMHESALFRTYLKTSTLTELETLDGGHAAVQGLTKFIQTNPGDKALIGDGGFIGYFDAAAEHQPNSALKITANRLITECPSEISALGSTPEFKATLKGVGFVTHDDPDECRKAVAAALLPSGTPTPTSDDAFIEALFREVKGPQAAALVEKVTDITPFLGKATPTDAFNLINKVNAAGITAFLNKANPTDSDALAGKVRQDAALALVKRGLGSTAANRDALYTEIVTTARVKAALAITTTENIAPNPAAFDLPPAANAPAPIADADPANAAATAALLNNIHGRITAGQGALRDRIINLEERLNRIADALRA